MNKINEGFSLAIVIIIVASLSAIFSSVIFFVSSNQYRILKELAKTRNRAILYDTIGTALLEMRDDIDEDITSPFEGWFADLPSTIKEVSVTYSEESSKIDINHRDLSTLKRIKILKKNTEMEKIKNIYFFYPWQFYSLIDEQKKDWAKKVFTIYKIPNLSTINHNRLKLYMKSLNKSDYFKKMLCSKLNITNNNNGKQITKSQFENLSMIYKRGKEDNLYKEFDYKGTINLNFVTRDVFFTLFRLNGQTNPNIIKKYWNKIQQKRRIKNSIKSVNEIFSKSSQYEKYFSCNSRVFVVTVKKDNMTLSVLVNRYKNFRGIIKTEILQYWLKSNKQG